MASPRYADRACLHVYYRHARYEFAPLATKETRKSDRARRSAAPSVKPVSSALGDIFLGGCWRRGAARQRGSSSSTQLFTRPGERTMLLRRSARLIELSQLSPRERIGSIYPRTRGYPVYVLLSARCVAVLEFRILEIHFYRVFGTLDGGDFYFEYLSDRRTGFLVSQ